MVGRWYALAVVGVILGIVGYLAGIGLLSPVGLLGLLIPIGCAAPGIALLFFAIGRISATPAPQATANPDRPYEGPR